MPSSQPYTVAVVIGQPKPIAEPLSEEDRKTLGFLARMGPVDSDRVLFDVLRSLESLADRGLILSHRHPYQGRTIVTYDTDRELKLERRPTGAISGFPSHETRALLAAGIAKMGACR